VKSKGDKHELKSGFTVKLLLPKKDHETGATDDSDREVPNIANHHHPHTGQTGDEPTRFPR
jgi:hypothetical protein